LNILGYRSIVVDTISGHKSKRNTKNTPEIAKTHTFISSIS
jgi:hypothetical protein